MLIALLTEKEYVTLRLPDRAEGKFALRDPKDGSVLFSFTGAGESWQIGESENGRLKKGEPEVLENGKLIRVRIRKDWENALLFAEEAKERYARFARVAVPDQATYRIGSSSACDFRLTLPFAAPYHCALSCAKRSWSVTDQGSETGTYVNGKRIAKGSHPLHPGDVVSVMNQKFIVLPGLLAFNAQSVDVAPLKTLFQPVRLPKLSHLKALGKEQETVFFHRQPRFTETAEAQEFSVEAPPEQQGQQDDTPALLTYGPAVTSGAVMLMGGLNPWMSAGMLASSILFPALNRKRMKALQAETEEKRRAVYSEYLNQMEQEIRTLEQKQTAFLRSHIIDPVSEANRLLQSDRDLWSRRPLHDDFLELRLGTGDIPTKANINFPAETLQLADDPMKDLLREFQERPRVLKNVPITMDLSRFYSVGIAGSSEHRLNFAASLIGQLVMHIGYDDLKLCLIGALHGPLKSLRWLPHTWDNAGDIHYTAGNREEMNRLVPLLDAELTLHRMEDRREKAAGSELVILITDAELAHTGVLTRLLFDRQYENVHIITLARHGSLLPSRTDAAISVLENKGRMVFQDGSQRMLRDFVPDLPLTDLTARLCDKMANTLLDLRTEASVLPTNVPFLELFGVQDVAHLNLLRRWEQANPIRTLSAPIGLSEDGDLLTLDIHEKGDGPHGLVAGTTGSGKSELLMTYILSMAVNYSPEDVAFALIDYKGGGMANAFQELPHTVGVITNLDGSSLERSLTSIESENKRRQTVFQKTQKELGLYKMEIGDYQKLYREGKVKEPMPHLIIITDEFAELKTQEPEFMQKLISAARVGRSLGIHLLLATQQPAGIVDEQIVTNTNFRLCLRMASTGDSQSILKTQDAAYLTAPGSFYKQVGTALLKGQSGYAGAEYTPDRDMDPKGAAEVLDHTGAVILDAEMPVKQRGGSMTQALALTNYIIETAKREGIRAKMLWAPELEERIPLNDLYERYAPDVQPWEPEAVLGEMDDPALQRRALVRIPFSDGKNSLIYGALGSGKMMALKTVLIDLLRHHTAEELFVYLLDYGNEGLTAFLPAPQVGDVVESDDEEKLSRFLNYLEEEIGTRKKLLGGELAALPLTERLQKSGLPRLLIVLHQLSALQEHLGDDLDRMLRIMREGPRYGIVFLATQESASGVRFQMLERFSRKYVLQMDHDDDYSSILGRTGGKKPGGFKGRGLMKEEDSFYEFQTASADEDITGFCTELNSSWRGKTAPKVRVMPECVTEEYLKDALDPEKPLQLPVGLDLQTIRPVVYPFDSRVVHLILGRPTDAHSFLSGLLPMAAANGLPVTVLDPENTYEAANGIEVVEKDGIEAVVSALFEACRQMKQQESTEERGKRLFVLPSIQRTLSVLQGTSLEKLQAILEKARPEWKWTFLIAETPQGIATLRYEGKNGSWISASLSTSEGLFLGSGISSQNFLQASGSTRELYQNISFPLGYVVRYGNAERIRFVMEEEEADV